MKESKIINADVCHEMLWTKMQPKLSFQADKNYEEWKSALKEKFIQLTGLKQIAENECPLNVQIEWEEDKQSYRLIRFTFDSEAGETVPCYLCIPKTGKKKYPVAITLQGHTTGFHNSIGVAKYERDELPHNAFALQAVERGFIALAIEQRGMGERKPTRGNRHNLEQCRYASWVAIQLGRTILGERMWDVHKAIDALGCFDECDLEKIFITGCSGGGTMSYYAACFDERIKFSVPSCSFCPYKESILDILHCHCNYIPSAYQWFDMPDLACLIAPRPLIVVTGQKDDIFPLEGVRRGFETVKKIYERSGAKENCRLIETPLGHRWGEEIEWDAIDETCQKLGWK